MKYCIGCKHLSFQPHEVGGGSTYTGTYTLEDAAMFCAKGRWHELMSEERGPVPAAFEKAMEHAETCEDFEERPTP